MEKVDLVSSDALYNVHRVRNDENMVYDRPRRSDIRCGKGVQELDEERKSWKHILLCSSIQAVVQIAGK